jgi:hypothetical protein
MTEINQLSDKELSEALNFHRRQRNLSRGVNESAHMRMTQMVRMLEAEEARRLQEAKQIDELSKKTLGSYVKKASTDQYLKGQAVQYHTNKAQTADGVFAKQSKEKHYDAADKALKKASNRDTGISRAADRLTKEEVEQIDELSKDTVNSYWKKAATARYPLDVKARKAQDQKTNRIRSGKLLAGYKPKDELSPEEKRTRMNRIKGMNNAGKRLFRSEEVELDEDTMPSNVASRLSDRHFTAAFSHKKNGNMKGYAAHLKVANRIEDAVIRVGSHMPIKSKQIEAASDKAFKEHPHRAVKTEEVELDEANQVKMSDLKVGDTVKMGKRFGGKQGIVKAVRKDGADVHVHGTESPTYAHQSNFTKINEASYRDIGARNMLKADRKAEKEVAKMRAQQAKANAKAAAKASKPEEFKEETNLRITKVYNKWPKKATYAVHSPDRKYYKEFDSMEAAKQHHSEKSGK